MKPEIRKKRLLFGIRLFIILTILGISAVFYATGSRQTLSALGQFRWPYFFLGGLLIAVDLLTGALRIFIFLRKMHNGKTFRASFEANLANIFWAAATPFQTGGGVAQLYVLNHYGVPYSAGLTVSVFNFTATLSLLFLAATLVLTELPHQFALNGSLLLAIDFSRAAFYVTLLLFLFFLFRPGWVVRAISGITRFSSGRRPSMQKRLEGLSQKLLVFISDYRQHLSLFWHRHPGVLVWNVVLTVILYFNKCLMAYVIFKGLGLRPGFWQVVMLQMLVVFFLYFAPTPGASLIAETGTSAVMSLIAPGYLLSLFAVLWRFFTTYFGVILGSLVLVRVVGLKDAAPDTSSARDKIRF